MRMERILAHNLANVTFARRSGANRATCAGGNSNFLQGLLETVGTIAVGELGARALGDVRLDLLPVVLVVADFLAHAANGEQAGELIDLGLQIKNALGHDQARGQLVLIERLVDEIIRPGPHAHQKTAFPTTDVSRMM